MLLGLTQLLQGAGLLCTMGISVFSLQGLDALILPLHRHWGGDPLGQESVWGWPLFSHPWQLLWTAG